VEGNDSSALHAILVHAADDDDGEIHFVCFLVFVFFLYMFHILSLGYGELGRLSQLNACRGRLPVTCYVLTGRLTLTATHSFSSQTSLT